MDFYCKVLGCNFSGCIREKTVSEHTAPACNWDRANVARPWCHRTYRLLSKLLSQPRDEIKGFILKSFYCGFPVPGIGWPSTETKHLVFEIWHSLKARFCSGCTRVPQVIRMVIFSLFALLINSVNMAKIADVILRRIPTEATRLIH